MRVNGQALFKNATISSTTSSSPYRVEHMEGFSVQISVAAGGTLVATATLEGSNDFGGSGDVWTDYSPSNASPTITNWTTISGTSASLNGTTGSPFLLNVPQVYFRWARLTITVTSGSSVITAITFSKGAPGGI